MNRSLMSATTSASSTATTRLRAETLKVTGNVGAIATQSGNVEVSGSVTGSVQTMSGDVDCGGEIGGSVNTMSGNIRSRR